MNKEECKHEEVKLVGAILNNHCNKCGGDLVVNEVEILNMFYEVRAFCENKECERYLILVV